MKDFLPKKNLVAFQTVFGYTVFGVLWILLSDKLLFGLNLPKHISEEIALIKGTLFVFISALLIFVIIRIALLREKKSEEIKLISEERLRNLFNNSLDAIFLTIPDGRIISANPAACKMLGRTEEEICKMGREGIIDPSDIRLTEMLQEREKNGFVQGELTFVKQDGTKFDVDITSSIFTLPSGEKYTTIIARDISTRKKTEQELIQSHQKLLALTNHLQNSIEEERSRISREIHDELGQALTALKMDIVMLKKSLQQSSDTEVVQLAQQEMPEIEKGIDFAINATRRIIRDLRPEILETLGVWEGIRWQCEEFMRRNKIIITLHLPENLPTINSQRSTIIFRIIQEALANIIKHSFATEVVISFRVDTETIIFNITDNGIGITKENIEKHNSFGLLGIQERLRTYNGTLAVHSESNRGTTLTISLPL